MSIMLKSQDKSDIIVVVDVQSYSHAQPQYSIQKTAREKWKPQRNIKRDAMSRPTYFPISCSVDDMGEMVMLGRDNYQMTIGVDAR